MAHEQFQELLAVQALSALDDADERALNEHLQTCPDCRAELDQWRATASTISFMGTPAEPSSNVRERILAQVRAERDSSPASSQIPAPTPSAKVVPFIDNRKRVPGSFGWVEAIAATVIVGLLISLFVLWRQNQAMQSEMARLSEDIRRTEAQLAHKQDLIVFMTKPDARSTELAGTDVAPGAHARIVYDKNGRAMLLAQGLPAAPADKEYQLWFIVGNNKMPGKTFGTDPRGNGDLNDEIPSAAMNGAVFAVTLEPKGGRPAPTGEVFLVSGS